MEAVDDLMLERFRGLLKQGTVFVNESDNSLTPKVLFFIDHSVREGTPTSPGGERDISRKLHFVLMDSEGNAQNGGPAPYLDYKPLPESCRAVAEEILQQPWLKKNLEEKAIQYASEKLVPEHYHEVRERRVYLANQRLKAVHARLTEEINYWENRRLVLEAEVQAGKQPRLQPENAGRTVAALTARLQFRTEELKAQKHITSQPAHIVGGALVLPGGLFSKIPELESTREDGLPRDPVLRKKMESIGMNAVMEAERKAGFFPADVSSQNLGWDITSTNDKGNCRFLEVKARQKGATCIHVTKNEMLVGFNRRDQGWNLVLVLVENDIPEPPRYIPSPFEREPGWAESGVSLNVALLLKKSIS